jgi:hypothetical protein
MVLGKSKQFAGVGHRVATFVDNQLVLHQREAGLRDRRILVETLALRPNIAVNVPALFSISALYPIRSTCRHVGWTISSSVCLTEPGARGRSILSSPPSLYTFRSPGALALHDRLGSVLSHAQQKHERFTDFTRLLIRVTPEGTCGLSSEVVLVATVEALLRAIFRVAQLAHLCQWLDLLAEDVGQLVRICSCEVAGLTPLSLLRLSTECRTISSPDCSGPGASAALAAYGFRLVSEPSSCEARLRITMRLRV